MNYTELNDKAIEQLLDEWGQRRRRVQGTVGLTAACPTYSRHLFAALHEDWNAADQAHITTCSKCKEVQKRIAIELHPHEDDLGWYVAASDEEQQTDEFADLRHHVEVLGCKACLRRCDELRKQPEGLAVIFAIKPFQKPQERLAASARDEDSPDPDILFGEGEWSATICSTESGGTKQTVVNLKGPVHAAGQSTVLAHLKDKDGDPTEAEVVSKPFTWNKFLNECTATAFLSKSIPNGSWPVLRIAKSEETAALQEGDSSSATDAPEQLSGKSPEIGEGHRWTPEREPEMDTAGLALAGIGRSLGGQVDRGGAADVRPLVIRMHMGADDPRIKWESGEPSDAQSQHLDIEIVMAGPRLLRVRTSGIARVEPGCHLALRWLTGERGTVNAEATIDGEDKDVLLDADAYKKANGGAGKAFVSTHILEIRFDRTASPAYSILACVPICEKRKRRRTRWSRESRSVKRTNPSDDDG